ncbi:monovalent cation/H(+) antiporter subunit G [bacterium]|nr:monovalent cation/H(+) antiporter subunit G [bacterium]
MSLNELVGMIIIGVGVAFDTFGCVGLLRLPTVYNRLQAGTKCVTFGTCGILFGVFIMKGFSSMGMKALIGIPFVLLTSPVAAHAIARGAHIFGVKLGDKKVIDRYEEDRGEKPEL